MAEFKDRLKEAIRSSNYTQQDLANFLEVNKSMISQWLSGRCSPNHPNKIIKIAKYLNVNPSWLCGFTDIKEEFQINERELKLLKGFKLLNEENKIIVENMINALPKEEQQPERDLKTA